MHGERAAELEPAEFDGSGELDLPETVEQCCAPPVRSSDSNQRTGDDTTISTTGAHSAIAPAIQRSSAAWMRACPLTAAAHANAASAVATMTSSALT